MTMIHRWIENHHDGIYAVFRVLIGLLFAQHGAQKLFGVWGFDAPVQLFSLMGLAGVIELVGGIMVAVGLWTRLGALLSAVTMFAAYFMAHAAEALIPVVNKGELALVYFAAFIAILAYGGGKYRLEKLFGKEEVF